MIESIEQRADHLVEIRLGVSASPYISCEVKYRTGGQGYLPATMVLSSDAEVVLTASSYVWNQAQTLGIVRLYERSEAVLYWNPYLDLGNWQGEVTLSIETLTTEGISSAEVNVDLKDRGVVYLSDWTGYLGGHGSSDPQPGDGAWQITNLGNQQVISIKHKEALPPARIPLPVKGLYDIYFGLPHGGLRLLARTKASSPARIMTPGEGMTITLGEYKAKKNKEVHWARRTLEEHDWLELTQLKETITQHHEFGTISYIKLVPVPASAKAAKLPSLGEGQDVILFYEPYSYSLHGFHSAERMNEVMLEEFLRFRPREITCQTVRVGCKSLHHSQFLEPFDTPARTDENTIIDDPIRLAQSGDILKATVQYAKGKGSRITANIGMNRPYLWLPALSEKFTRDHPHLIKGGDFDYRQDEVRNYAKRILQELVASYEIDGLFLDYMRHFSNQTEETLIDVIQTAHGYLKEKGAALGRRLELKVRVPADQLVYYRAMRTCVEEGWLDGIVPSNMLTSDELPPVAAYQQLCQGTSTKVYGLIDLCRHMLAHDPRAGSLLLGHTPKSLEQAWSHYESIGVDGIMVYQADLLTGNPYLSKMFGV